MTENSPQQTNAADELKDENLSHESDVSEVVEVEDQTEGDESPDSVDAEVGSGSESGNDDKLQKGVEKRIKSLTARNKRFEEEIRALRHNSQVAPMPRLDIAALSDLPGAPRKPERPDHDDFGDDIRGLMRAQAKYTEEYSDYLAQRQSFEQTVHMARQKIQGEQLKRRELIKKVQVDVRKFSEMAPDFAQKLAELDSLTTGIAQDYHTNAIYKSDLSAEILYYLANNPDDAIEFAYLDPVDAGYAVAKIERKLAKDAGKSSAPSYAPMGTVRKGAESATKELSIDDLRKIHSKR